MRIFWQQFQTMLTPGVGRLLALLTIAYLATLAAKLSHWVDLAGLLALNGPTFWGGQGWRLMTYPLAPAGISDFLVNGFGLILLGGRLERHWSRSEFWTYCAVAVAGAGLAKVGLEFSRPESLLGAMPMVFGLLVAWAFICGRETVSLMAWGPVTVWKIVAVAGVAGCLATWFAAGIFAAVVMASGGVWGWGYLWLKQKRMMGRAATVAHSKRIQRLEI